MFFSRRIPTFNIIIALILLPGLIVATWRCVLRIIGEEKNHYVEIVADFEEFKQLSLNDSLHIRDLLGLLKATGAASIVVSEDTLESLEKEGRITVMTNRDIRKLSLDKNFEIEHPIAQNIMGTLWIQTEDISLLSRIEHILSLKIPPEKLIRIHQNLLLINKSTQGFKERVGLGFSHEAIEMAHENDLGVLLKVFNYPGLTLETAEKLINMLPPPASVSAIIFGEEVLGYRGEKDKIINLIKQRAYRICEIEFTNQKGMKDYIKALAPKRLIAKAHSISRKELDLKYNHNTATARWVRAAKERSISILYLRCFLQDEKNIIDDLIAYNLKYLENTVKALSKSGFKMAATHQQRISEPRLIIGKPVPAELFVMGLSLFSGLLILLKMTIHQNLKNASILLYPLVLAIIFIFTGTKYWIMASGVIGAISYATIGLVWALNSLNKNNETNFFKIIPAFIFKMFSSSMFGGILICGLYSSVDYILKYDQFRGIKLAFILPVIFSAMWAIKLYGSGLSKLLYKPINAFSLFLIFIASSAFILYIMRSGNLTFLKPTGTEENFRIMLEDLLIARPRYKEFLVGYPAAFLFLYFYLRKTFSVLPLLVVFIQMGQVSILNSMCHFHTPLLLTFLRIFNGLWIGIIISLIILCVTVLLRLLYKFGAEKQKKILLIGYFGYGNGGDELLWQTFAERFSTDFPEHKISVLYSDASTNQVCVKYKLIKRSNIADVLDELLSCEILVVPGGGVFQSSTSNASLAYYLLLTAIARLSGGKILLPSQGLGPWNKETVAGRLLTKWAGYELVKANYLSVRDDKSKEEFIQLTGQKHVPVTTDLVFLNNSINKPSQRNVHKTTRVYAVLRSSIKESAEIANSLMRMAATNENLELYPIAMQPEEDEKVWLDAGWTGEIKNALNCDNFFEDADIVVSMRLHGCILASVACIPWVGISYDPKVKAYAESCKWDLCVSPADTSEEYFTNIFSKLKKSRAVFSEQLHNIATQNTEIAENNYLDMMQTLRK